LEQVFVRALQADRALALDAAVGLAGHANRVVVVVAVVALGHAVSVLVQVLLLARVAEGKRLAAGAFWIAWQANLLRVVVSWIAGFLAVLAL